MINLLKELRDVVVADATVNAATGGNVYAGLDYPPPGVLPSASQPLCFKVRGGGIDFSAKVLYPSIQFKSYGTQKGVAGVESAITLDRALFDAIDSFVGYPIRSINMEQMGQSLFETDTEWPFVLSFYQLMVLNT